MVVESESQQRQQSQPVDAGELNEWRRGFTPQAEIWNGRLAMLGLSLGLLTLILVRLFSEEYLQAEGAQLPAVHALLPRMACDSSFGLRLTAIASWDWIRPATTSSSRD